MVGFDVFVVRWSMRSVKVVPSKLDRMLGRTSRWGLGGDRMVMEEAADSEGCSRCLLSGHWSRSRFVFAEVTGPEGSRFDRDTVGPELVGR